MSRIFQVTTAYCIKISPSLIYFEVGARPCNCFGVSPTATVSFGVTLRVLFVMCSAASGCDVRRCCLHLRGFHLSNPISKADARRPGLRRPAFAFVVRLSSSLASFSSLLSRSHVRLDWVITIKVLTRWFVFSDHSIRRVYLMLSRDEIEMCQNTEMSLKGDFIRDQQQGVNSASGVGASFVWVHPCNTDAKEAYFQPHPYTCTLYIRKISSI